MKQNYIVLFILISFLFNLSTQVKKIDYKDEMIHFVISISKYAKAENTNFIIIPQNALDIVSTDTNASDTSLIQYMAAIDGIGIEDMFYGYLHDNIKTPKDITKRLYDSAAIFKNAGKTILVIDYCSSKQNIDNSYLKNNLNDYLSFAADERNLTTIPSYPIKPYCINNFDINELSNAKNFLYLINPEKYLTKNAFIDAIKPTDFDMLVIDLFVNDEELTQKDIQQIKVKKNGGRRLVLCYMSIGEAENYRYYWKKEWDKTRPIWIKEENPDWIGNYTVAYWNEEWQQIIYGKKESYLNKIINSGFDGVYLDVIDAYEYFYTNGCFQKTQ